MTKAMQGEEYVMRLIRRIDEETEMEGILEQIKNTISYESRNESRCIPHASAQWKRERSACINVRR